MKSLTVALIASQAAPQLLGLHEHYLLSTEERITPLETIAFIETYDEVPVFGGMELRELMLAKNKMNKQGFASLELPLNLHDSLQTAS